MSQEIATKLVYPDPMKPAGLTYILPAEALVTIEIFDESGRSLRVVCRRKSMKAGSHILVFNTMGLSEGEYTVRIIASIGQEEHRATKNIQIKQCPGCFTDP